MIDLFLSKASVAEAADIANNVSSAIDLAALTDDFLTRGNQKLKSLAAGMVAGIGAERGKELKDEIDDADLTRDNRLVTLTMFLKAHVNWGRETTGKAASQLLNIIRSHGKNITRRGLEKESAALDSILGELAKEENAAAVTTLNLTELVGDLSDAQATFKSLYQQSAELESAKTQEEAPSSIRKETIDQMNTLINYLNMRYADDSSVYGPLTIKIAEMVSSINEKIRTRNTARETANSKTTVNN